MINSGLFASDLTVSRAEQTLIEGAELHLAPSSITYLYGENGAGKTSLMRCLCGLLPADQGSIRWNGKPISSSDSNYFNDLLFLAHALSMKAELSIMENLHFYAKLRGVNNANGLIQQAAQQLGIDHLLARRFAELSAGQQHKVALCRLVVEPAKIWILDEPFVNLDHQTRDWLANTMMEFAKQGGVVLFTSHHEIEQLTIDQRLSLEH
ncbi:MAG: heme ABC exporter ATP-binding protein CcmA [Kangiellaceae bacterium]|nr:heme ABC exporter ATP-binding protein CcmA [Kangiellaceae bacterium]